MKVIISNSNVQGQKIRLRLGTLLMVESRILRHIATFNFDLVLVG